MAAVNATMMGTIKVTLFSLPLFLLSGGLLSKPVTQQAALTHGAMSNLPSAVSARSLPNPKKMFLPVSDLRKSTPLNQYPRLRVTRAQAGLGDTNGPRPSEEDRSKNNESWEMMGTDQELSKPTIWKIEMSKPVLMDDVNNVQFESDKNYIVMDTDVTQKSPENWQVYYRIGSQSSGSDAGDAASGAVFIDHRIHQRIKIRREPEGGESRAFKTLVKLDETKHGSSTSNSRSGDAKKIRMFLMEGKDKLSFKEVELSLQHAYDSDTCIVFVCENVYVNCGYFAADKLRTGARALGKIMASEKGLKEENVIQIRRPEADINDDYSDDNLRQFYADFARNVTSIMTGDKIIENPYKFTLEDERRILGQTFMTEGEEWFNLNVIKIYENSDNGHIMEECILFRQIPLKKLNAKDCYLIDSNSNVGFFVWMGRESSVDLQRETARKAELHVEEEYADYKTNITYVHQDDVPPDVTCFENMVVALNPQKKIEEE